MSMMRGRRRYGECHKNHACSIGGKAHDGCGEFLAGSGTDGLHCAACGCHRSFHKPPSPQSETKQKKQQQEEEEQEEQEEQQQQQPQPQQDQQKQQPEATFQAAPTTVLLALPAFPNYISVARRRPAPQPPIPQPQPQPSSPSSRFVPVDMEVERTPRTRTRARYSEEQKARMRDFADMAGWQMRRENEEALLRMCTEIGVPRQMFKVWMHNNKAKYAVQVGTSVTASATAPPLAEY